LFKKMLKLVFFLSFLLVVVRCHIFFLQVLFFFCNSFVSVLSFSYFAWLVFCHQKKLVLIIDLHLLLKVGYKIDSIFIKLSASSKCVQLLKFCFGLYFLLMLQHFCFWNIFYS
jgi:hypothetical protein